MCVKPISMSQKLYPCQKCPECLSKRACEWAQRCGHELSYSTDNTYLTLTYSDEALAQQGCFNNYLDFQLFLKRLRHKAKKKISFLVSSEFGGQTGRYHHHAIIFGWYPKDPVFLRTSPSGYPLFSSMDLSKTWTHGFHSFAPATVETSYYIANYALKNNAYINADGEILSDSMKSSRNPAIGLRYFHDYRESLVAIACHKQIPLPRYYQKKLEEYYPNLKKTYDDFFDKIEYKEYSKQEAIASLKEQMSKMQITDAKFRQKRDLSALINELNKYY